MFRHTPDVPPMHRLYTLQGCESSDFNLISDFCALHKTPFSDFYKCIEKHISSGISDCFRLFQTFFLTDALTPLTLGNTCNQFSKLPSVINTNLTQLCKIVQYAKKINKDERLELRLHTTFFVCFIAECIEQKVTVFLSDLSQNSTSSLCGLNPLTIL